MAYMLGQQGDWLSFPVSNREQKKTTQREWDQDDDNERTQLHLVMCIFPAERKSGATRGTALWLHNDRATFMGHLFSEFHQCSVYGDGLCTVYANSSTEFSADGNREQLIAVKRASPPHPFGN